MTDSDRVELEKIFRIENIIPEKVGLTKTRNLRKLTYIGLPIFFILSILIYRLGHYILFTICIITIFSYLISYIAFIYLKQKIEKTLNKGIWQKSTYSKREIVNDEILDDGKCILKLSEVKNVIKYHNLFLLFIVDNKVRALKIGEEQAPEFIDILNTNHISFEEREEPFNMYSYLKKNK